MTTAGLRGQATAFVRMSFVIIRHKGKREGDWDATLMGKEGSPLLGALEKEGLAYRSGLREGDLLVSVNGVLISGHAEAVTQLDACDGESELVVDRQAVEPLDGILCCGVGCTLLGFSLAFAVALVLRALRGTGDADDSDIGRLRDKMPKLRYGGPQPWRARCFPARTKYTVASWPTFAHKRRFEVRVDADVEAVGIVAHPLWGWDSKTPVCIVSARSGIPVDNYAMSMGPQQRRGVPSGMPRQRQIDSHPAAYAHALIFEPSSGPGVYEIYDNCHDPYAAPVEPAWRAAALADSSRHPASGEPATLDPTAQPWRSVTFVRRVARSTVQLGSMWAGDGSFSSAGANRKYSGNVRAVVQVTDDLANSSEPAIRVIVRWRRPTESPLSYGEKPIAVRVNGDEQVPCTILSGDNDELEMLLAHDNIPGTYVVCTC